MALNASFDVLMDRLRQGDQSAARQIFQRFACRLVGLARAHLDSKMRQKVDPEEVMQSAFKSFFWRYAEGQFDFADWDSLGSLLTLFTLRKCGHKVEHFRAACRDVRREAQVIEEADSSASWQAIAREPTPEEAFQLTETVEELFRGLDDADRQAVELSLQGYKAAEISAQVGLSERTVYRLLDRIKAKLQRFLAEGPAD
jgi:RNA polymerase sigma-70 factor (ECF subfamily)